MRNKYYTSGDGLLQLNSCDITNVCVAPSLFSFFHYLLLVDEHIARYHTYYFLNDTVSPKVREQLISTYYSQRPDSTFIFALKKRLRKIGIAFFKTIKYPFLNTARIYAFDYPVLCIYIGNRPYEMLSDAPQCFTYHMRENSEEYQRQIARRHTLLWWVQKLIYGDIYADYYGNNKWCQCIHLLEENQSPILDSKNVKIQSLEELWSNATESKRQFIISLFGLNSEDISLLRNKPIIFFTQPLIEDCKLSYDDYCDLLNKLFSHYDKNDIIIKTHPRDKFDYSKYFPEIAVYSKTVNSQLLQLLGLSPKRVVTFCSSAVEAFPESVECDYYGTNVHPSVQAFFGDYKLKRFVNRIPL